MVSRKRPTPSELKRLVQENNIDSHFFDRETMRYFGDTMANFAVSPEPVIVETWLCSILVWELCRKKPVKGGLQEPFYFDVDTYRRVFKKR